MQSQSPWKWIALVAVVTALGQYACATRLHGGVYDEDGGTDDMAVARVDLITAPVEDLADPPPKPDLAVPLKNCGDVMKCVLQCGVMLGGCQAMCFQGASPEGLQQAGALVGCIIPNCVLNQRDGGGQGDILLCALSKCQQQISMCKGFGF